VLETSHEVVSSLNAGQLRLNRGGYNTHCDKEESGSCSNLHSKGRSRIRLQERAGCGERDGQAYLEEGAVDGMASGL